MRLMRLWKVITLPTNLKLVWDRITFSRLTIAYFIFSVVHFIIQLSLQSKAFTINANSADFLFSIVQQGQGISKSLPLFDKDILRMCGSVPSNLNVDLASCRVVWNGTQTEQFADGTKGFNDGALPMKSSRVVLPPTPSSAATTSSVNIDMSVVTSTRMPSRTTITIFVAPTPTLTVDPYSNERHSSDRKDDVTYDGDADQLKKRASSEVSLDGDSTPVNISGLGYKSLPAFLDPTCVVALNWPVSVLSDTKREDIVFVAFQFWVLGMSVVALLNESIPHTLASLLTHLMATSWAAFQLSNTAKFHSNFDRAITDGACNGITFLPTYWIARGNAEIPSLVLNISALILSCFLSWRLVKLFGWQTFKRVGASRSINHIYKIVLILSIAIQLSLFFMVVTVSLWLDQLYNGVIDDFADYQILYKVTSFITLGLLLPWLIAGWFGVRRELRIPIFFFLTLSILYLGGWSVMFFSTTFRWIFITWTFFSIMAVASVFLTVLSFILGVVCRFNFGKGLPRYLNTKESLPGDDFIPYYGVSDIEKVDFPSKEKHIPAFGSEPDVLVPSLMFASPMGSKTFDKAVDPSKPPFNSSPILRSPPSAITRNTSSVSSDSVALVRSSSHGSYGSTASIPTYSQHFDGDYHHTKRWAIE